MHSVAQTHQTGSRSEASVAHPGHRRANFLICLGLAVITVLVYLPLRDHQFVYLDDKEYVTENPHVLGGLSLPQVAWVFSHAYAGNWHPLTWVSHMLDCQLWGLQAGGHHLTNIFFHTTNSVLLFLVLTAMTAARWRCAFVA